jgi:DNA-binding NtrC family response regulator
VPDTDSPLQDSIEILHLEDSSLDADFVQRRLEAAGLRFRVSRAVDRQSFIDQLKSRQFDVILSDLQVPGFEELGALDTARKLQPQVPFIYVSGAMGDEVAVETLKRGATDYVLKDRLGRLGAAVERALTEARERRQRQQAEERAAGIL